MFFKKIFIGLGLMICSGCFVQLDTEEPVIIAKSKRKHPEWIQHGEQLTEVERGFRFVYRKTRVLDLELGLMQAEAQAKQAFQLALVQWFMDRPDSVGSLTQRDIHNKIKNCVLTTDDIFFYSERDELRGRATQIYILQTLNGSHDLDQLCSSVQKR
jgi:hypothetical protein